MNALRMTAIPQLYVSCWIIVWRETMGCGRRGGSSLLLWSKSCKRLSMVVRSKGGDRNHMRGGTWCVISGGGGG